MFLGAADEELRKEFPQYYASVQNETDALNGAIEIKHYFLSSNIISMLGYVCQYNHEHHYDIMPQVEEILDFIAQSTALDGMLSTRSLFKLSTGATKLRPYFKQFESNGVFSKIIRKILLPNSAYKVSLYKNNNNEYAAFWLIGFNNMSDFEADSNIEYLTHSDSIEQSCHQIIYYGAPGTGKSHKIKSQLEKVIKDNIFRTTFHPDSDYSTFVGAYKPTMEKPTERVYAKGELINKLTEMKEGGITYAPQKFGAKYWRSLKQLSLSDKKEILQACGMSDNYTVEFDKGVAVGEEYLASSNESHIIYSFVPQVFLKAYIQAYKKPNENIYLIIEEINRGNCAQIFGDLFQLLDRDDNGVSEYKIKADADIVNYLEEKLGKDSTGIKDGELCLPSNLYIYATMNTSDQSLFPIDSAFKRRWDWEYEPIKYKNTDWGIEIGNNLYSWTSFQKKVNEKIFEDTNSEDKMLGDYFIKANNENVISEKLFVNKVLFYLWNDVCKDGDSEIFKTDDNKDVKFSDLYGDKGTEILHAMMKNLGVELLSEEEEYEYDEDDSNSPDEKSKRRNKYTINNGTEQYTTPQTVKHIIEDYAKDHKDISVEEMLTKWNRISQRKNCLREYWEPSPNDNQKFADRRYIPIEWDNKVVWLINGWTEELFKIFIHNVKEEFGIEIKKVDAPIH